MYRYIRQIKREKITRSEGQILLTHNYLKLLTNYKIFKLHEWGSLLQFLQGHKNAKYNYYYYQRCLKMIP